MITSDAYVRFGPDGPSGGCLAAPFRQLVHLLPYLSRGPADFVGQGPACVGGATVPVSGRVTPQDLDTAQRLADAVAAYIAELGARMAVQDLAADEGEAA